MTERTLARAIRCLEPVRDRLVIVGGTAHRLFPLHPLGKDPGFELLTTEDVDIAAPLELAHDGSRTLAGRLEEAGFETEMRGAESPSYTYRLRSESASYLQFIAPLTGSGLARDGSHDHELRFSGIHAEKLRHVDILMHEPWSARIGLDDGELTVRVVNPVAFLTQKLLVLPGRGAKRGKDLLYVFDSLAIFGESLGLLREQSHDLAPTLSKSVLRQIRKSAAELCFEESAVSRESAIIAAAQRPHAPDSAQIVAACRVGLREVLGDVVPLL